MRCAIPAAVRVGDDEPLVTHTLDGWIPFRVRTDAPRAIVDWCHLGNERFTAPFFGDTIERCLRTPFNQLFLRETGVDMLLERAAISPGLRPTALIFHTSRCGSTLLAQMAASMPRTVVLSEAPPVDNVLRAPVSDTVRIEWLRALIGALAQPRDGDAHLIIKFDAWHTAQIALVQHAFPDVPCVFVYRDPEAVVASQLRMPGMQTLPGVLEPGTIGLDPEQAAQLDREEYVARVLGSVYEAGNRAADERRITLVNYSEFPSRATALTLEWCAPADASAARERLDQVVRFDAKTPSLTFEARPSTPLTPRAAEMTARFVRPHFAQLEARRLAV